MTSVLFFSLQVELLSTFFFSHLEQQKNNLRVAVFWRPGASVGVVVGGDSGDGGKGVAGLPSLVCCGAAMMATLINSSLPVLCTHICALVFRHNSHTIVYFIIYVSLCFALFICRLGYLSFLFSLLLIFVKSFVHATVLYFLQLLCIPLPKPPPSIFPFTSCLHGRQKN